MKKFLTVVGLLTVVATPAFAQSYASGFGTGNVIDLPALEQERGHADTNSAFAQTAQKHKKPPNRKTVVDPYGGAANGAGSDGYNWELEQD